jgi:hypothetical protein
LQRIEGKDWNDLKRYWRIKRCERNIKSKENFKDSGSRYRFRANIEGFDEYWIKDDEELD